MIRKNYEQTVQIQTNPMSVPSMTLELDEIKCYCQETLQVEIWTKHQPWLLRPGHRE